MEKYIEQLLADIKISTENLIVPVPERGYSLEEWISQQEEDNISPKRGLEELTGIRKEQLPPEEMLSDNQVNRLLTDLKKLLDTCNWSYVLQIEVPERIQYANIRDNFDQMVKVKRWDMGFFENCRPGTEHKKCSLGEYCQCAIFSELFSGFIDENLTPEEERAMQLECEIKHLKRKHGNDWMKYYPYHLDKNYDDENGNHYDYGFGEDEDDDPDDWWKK